ncbi:YbhB/YbcL family Raf kinase inhibitor-like protein [Billgrantia gudaonensis]|uniref:Phospholipid-binding protein, PBP family n=1 Tax=Billgrantia gudaonensis TaxID=376427 RepID=A0A1G9DF49_9GAMM|nr:YbhB/YbcL family Raf kinase inhibitor-like protein [Halomonas gudaonensis]SDK62470.1 phospholipid-binding protein, PBP family [Halomonas gudaonensis]
MAFALSNMQLESSAFASQGAIPTKHTGEGDDVSPALSWQGAPEGAKGFAVICHDPDAPLVQHGTYGFVHWVLYNLPGSTTSLEENTNQGTSGKNDFGKLGYGGPMPPEGHGLHQYYFWVLALDKPTDLPEGLSLPEVLKQLEPNLIGMNRLVGTYQRD